jgi:hypothetical protein
MNLIWSHLNINIYKDILRTIVIKWHYIIIYLNACVKYQYFLIIILKLLAMVTTLRVGFAHIKTCQWHASWIYPGHGNGKPEMSTKITIWDCDYYASMFRQPFRRTM